MAERKPEKGPMSQVEHRTIQTNGIEMHIAEAGEGPLGSALSI